MQRENICFYLNKIKFDLRDNDIATEISTNLSRSNLLIKFKINEIGLL